VSDFRQELLKAFPESFINGNDEFIAHKYSNQYIILSNCQSREDVECKVVEWFSRPAHKTAPYRSEWRNKKFHEFMLNGVNEFLGTNFTEEDMDVIYTPLGNAINHNKTLIFVRNGYDMSVLREGAVKDE
jgi:hypothetical protein